MKSIKIVTLLVTTSILYSCTSAVEKSNVQGQPICGLNHTIKNLSSPKLEHVLVVAHRGGHKNSPENSVSSVKEAIHLGVDIVELDVRLTKDKVLVLMHDETVDRTTTGMGLISDYTFDDLRKLKLNDNTGSITQEQVPTFSEALDAAGNAVMVHIDLKDYSDKTINIIAKLLEERGIDDKVSFYHKDTAILGQVKNHLPNAFLMPMAYDPEEAVMLSKKGYKLVHVQPHYISSELSKTVNTYGSSSFVNTLHNPDEIAAKGDEVLAFSSFESSNVDIIQTDEPEILIGYLTKKNARSCRPKVDL